MKLFSITKLFTLTILFGVMGCVDKIDFDQLGNIDILVVDGMITNLAEEQIIRINLSKTDPVTKLFGSTPVTKAKVELKVDASQIIALEETISGTYQLPNNFVGQVGRSYQLLIQLANGKMYESSAQVMPYCPPIGKITPLFNPTSLSGDVKAAHDFYLDTKDPADQHNYYRWDWNLYEKQDWCRSCVNGVYAVNNILPGQYKFGQYVSGDKLYEDCFSQPVEVLNAHFTNADAPIYANLYWVYDYPCRTKCWEILRNTSMNLFDDQNTNGGSDSWSQSSTNSILSAKWLRG